jgi:endonuclease-3
VTYSNFSIGIFCYNRTGLARGKTPEKVEALLEKRVPQPFRLHAHHWLILHGRYTCKARAPECWRCPVVDLCAYRNKVLEAPVGKGKRPSSPS